MEKVYFYSTEELILFCDRLYRNGDEINIQWKTDKHWGNELSFISNKIKIEHLIHCFVHVFMTFRFTSMIKSVVKTHYYYTNEDEISRIIELTSWLIAEDDRHQDSKNTRVKQKLYEVFKQHVIDKPYVHFDSVVTFRMSVFKQYVIDLVGSAIDEFKREEEHQTFIQSVREYVKKRKPKSPLVHVIQDNPFLFFDERGERYELNTLTHMMKDEPLYIIGLDEREYNLSPLLALLPAKIQIYGKNPTEARTQSIINVFQERVQFLALDQFPFQIP